MQPNLSRAQPSIMPRNSVCVRERAVPTPWSFIHIFTCLCIVTMYSHMHNVNI